MPRPFARDIASKIGSRICHDLISPIGAIANGFELLSLTQSVESPELSLISKSVENANARLRFFRIAFGATSTGQSIGAPEMADILTHLSTPRLQYQWRLESDCLREEAKLACLMLLCLETALPKTGEIQIGYRNEQWQLHARGDTLAPDTALWARLNRPDVDAEDLSPGQIQFLLAPLQADLLGRRIHSMAGGDKLTLTA